MFLPLKDDNPTSRTPVITIGIITLNVLVYVYYNLRLDDAGMLLFSMTYGLIPYEITHFQEISANIAMTQLRGLNAADTPALTFPIFGTLFTSMFMHGGFMHLFGNMLYLWIFGNNIEDYFGPIRFLVFYVVGGIAAVALHIAFSPQSIVPLIGASGAISAVLGAYFVLYPRARVLALYFLFFFVQTAWLPASIVLGIYFVLQFINALLGWGAQAGGGVAWFAHLGGFAFGWGLLKVVSRRRAQWRESPVDF